METRIRLFRAKSRVNRKQAVASGAIINVTLSLLPTFLFSWQLRVRGFSAEVEFRDSYNLGELNFPRYSETVLAQMWRHAAICDINRFRAGLRTHNYMYVHMHVYSNRI